MANVEEILSERGDRYGKFAAQAQLAQDLKNTMHNAPKWAELSASKKEALEMIQHKVARILNGDPDYEDNWLDIQGYAGLEIKIIAGNGI